MAVSVMQGCLAVVWSVLTIVLAVTGANAQPTVTITMRLAEAEWHVVRQEVLPRFEAVCNCRIRAIDIPPETLVQRLRAMQQAGRMEIDLFAQDNMRLRELVVSYPSGRMSRSPTIMLRSSRNTASSRRVPGQNSSPWPVLSMKKSR